MKQIYILIFCYLCTHPCSTQTFKDSLMILDKLDVYFENDSFSLDQASYQKIQDFVSKNKIIKGINLTLEGHTNSIGNIEYNQILSDNRVNTIMQFLMGIGWSPNQIKFSSWGKTKPEHPDDDLGMVLNRQVKISATKNLKLRKIIGNLNPNSARKKGVKIEFKSKLFQTSVHTDELGYFEVYLPDKLPIAVSAKEAGFINDYYEIVPNDKTNPLSVKMMELKEGSSIYITSLNFFGDKNILIESSKASLNHLTDQIKQNNEFCFEIQGHVNAPHLKPENITKYLFDLSIARAGFVYEHFKNNGVNVNRMIANGYGNTHMLYPKPKNEEQHLFNRRVELKILSCQEISQLREGFDEEFFINMSHKKLFR